MPDFNVADASVATIRASRDRPSTRWLETPAEPNGKTLVIVASGPSAWKALATLNGLGYDVMALNMAYSALINAGHPVPKYFAMLDARDVNVNFVKDPRPETEFILASQVHPDVFERLGGHSVTTFHLNTETEQKVFGGTEGLFLGSAGGTIGSTALAIAGLLGYRHLVLVGYDSSFGEASHLVPQPQNIGQQTMPVEFNGKWYTTTPTLAAQVTEMVAWLNMLHATFPGLTVDFLGEGLLYDYLRYVYTGAEPVVPKRTREEEAAQYAAIYSETPNYRCTQPRLDALRRALTELPPFSSYLDISCGRGESLDMAKALGIPNVMGTETVPELVAARTNVVRALLPDTGLPDKCADVVSLVEVLEHLLPEDVVPALRELDRLARKHIIVSACTLPAMHGLVDLHPSRRPEAEWDALFRSIWGDKVKRLPYDMHPSPAWLITI